MMYTRILSLILICIVLSLIRTVTIIHSTKTPVVFNKNFFDVEKIVLNLHNQKWDLWKSGLVLKYIFKDWGVSLPLWIIKLLISLTHWTELFVDMNDANIVKD